MNAEQDIKVWRLVNVDKTANAKLPTAILTCHGSQDCDRKRLGKHCYCSASGIGINSALPSNDRTPHHQATHSSSVHSSFPNLNLAFEKNSPSSLRRYRRLPEEKLVMCAFGRRCALLDHFADARNVCHNIARSAERNEDTITANEPSSPLLIPRFGLDVCASSSDDAILNSLFPTAHFARFAQLVEMKIGLSFSSPSPISSEGKPEESPSNSLS